MASGSAVSKLFLTLGVVYLIVMLFGAWLVRVPPEGWRPEGFDPAKVRRSRSSRPRTSRRRTPSKTPQFWLLWTVLFCNVTAGIGILEQAAPMIQDFFREGGTTVVAAAAPPDSWACCRWPTWRRFVWSSTSDVVGRKPIYVVYLGVGVLLYVTLALGGGEHRRAVRAARGPDHLVLRRRVRDVPAYLKDLFGSFQVGAVHGRLLTAWSAAGVAGPLIINGFLDAQGTPGDLTARGLPAGALTMVAVLGSASWPTC